MGARSKTTGHRERGCCRWSIDISNSYNLRKELEDKDLMFRELRGVNGRDRLASETHVTHRPYSIQPKLLRPKAGH